MGEAENQVEGREPAEDNAGVESDEDWPVLSELELDVCVSAFVPGANTPDADAEDA